MIDSLIHRFIRQSSDRLPSKAKSVASGRRPCQAFTLIELLVVVSIVMLLIAILLPALKHARESANRVACMAQFRQWGIALNSYADDGKEWFPYGEYWGATYMDRIIDTYLGDAGVMDKMLVCPSREVVDAYVHSNSWTDAGGRLTRVREGTLHYFGGHGRRGFEDAVGGSYPRIGWASSNFKNNFRPTPTRSNLFANYMNATFLSASDQVIMTDQANYVSSPPRPYIHSQGRVYVNHPTADLAADGMNLLYVDGHVRWQVAPWDSTSGNLERYHGGRGKVGWQQY